TEVMASQHWTWAGPTPDLLAADLATAVNPGNIGKVNLINNFCIATPSNDKRCDQCHAGYGGDPDAGKPQKSARAYTAADSSIPLANRVDCLVCHSDPTAAYAKDPKNFGNPVATLNLAAAAQDIRRPTRTNCGVCHFYAGGGDNVKLMGSSLKNPTEAIDVHMGRGMECSDCHAGPSHAFKGAGVHTPAHTQRVSCADCHGAAPHAGKVATNGTQLDTHAQKIGCQTCHIPKFSRGQFGKVDWDWSTAGDNTKGVAGVITTKVNDDGTPNAASLNSVVTYDYIKGNFTWQKGIAPGYRWSNGKSTHALTSDKGDLVAKGLTSSDADRISLGEPVGGPGDGKIMPFKVMRGRQAVYIDGVNSFVPVPNVFGPGSFWGTVQAPGFSFATYDFDGAGPIAAGAESIEALWGKVLAVGAAAAGQVPAGTPAFVKYDGVNPGFDWRYTKLYMDLNHEVAPKAQALGAAGCTDCHSASPKLPLCELYAGRTPPGGVTCP
ncbi:MAG TPA: cytochrome c3 family protein, partial [Anaeromyxobacteraceae bacterium]|nr:cytochrome c3 family protein [Anaeromyxobacteraceae bacterium]